MSGYSRWRNAIDERLSCEYPPAIAGNTAATTSEEEGNRDDEHTTGIHPASSAPPPPPLKKLPIMASDYYKDYTKTAPIGWTPKLRTILAGIKQNQSSSITADITAVAPTDTDTPPNSPLQYLRGFEDTILRHIVSYFAHEYVQNIKLTLPAKYIGRIHSGLVRFETREDYFNEYEFIDEEKQRNRYEEGGWQATNNNYTTETEEDDHVSFVTCRSFITFPEPNDRNVNMMPFILGDINSLPEDLRCYYPCIQACPIEESEHGKVCYLTIHESFVDAQSTQRREGLHIETPGLISSSSPSSQVKFVPGEEHHWGGGHFFSHDCYTGGIYFASNMDNTSVIFNALVDKNIPGIVDRHGNCEHLRPFIGPGTKLDAGQLVWMTDRTPHEAIGQEEDGYRQFFRVVTSQVSHWFKKHSTENPNVPLPKDVIVVEGDKFQ